MKRFRIIEFSSSGNTETENKLNQEIKQNEKIIHFSVEKNPNVYSQTINKFIIRAILEVNP